MSQKWALVTGASGGLGTALCQRLAAEGYALCLVDRSQQKSTELRLSLPTGTPAESIIADLSDPAQVQCVCERIAAWEQLALVINNAGVSTSGDFLTLSGEAELTSLRVNMEALYRISRAAAARMCEQGHGTLINIASIVAFQPIPGWTTYAATKAFVLSFTEGLAHELRGSGVRVVAVCPGFTKTNLYAAQGAPGLAGRTMPMMSPDAVARAVLSKRRGVVRVVGRMNWLTTLGGRVMPRALLRHLMGMMFSPRV